MQTRSTSPPPTPVIRRYSSPSPSPPPQEPDFRLSSKKICAGVVGALAIAAGIILLVITLTVALNANQVDGKYYFFPEVH